jgi:endonuclease/exonuclease/phosphatase family metal-dependent hydrolase
MNWLKRILYALLALIAAAVLFFGWLTVSDYRPKAVLLAKSSGNAAPVQETDSIFTIKSWNIGYFGLGKECDFFYDGGKMTRPSRTEYIDYSGNALKYLEEEKNTDFYFFQEVDFYSRRSYYDDQLARLRSTFPGMESASAINYKVPFVPVPLSNPLGRVNSGLVSFSRFHSTENSRYAFPGGYSWPTRLAMLDRCFLLSRLPLSGGKDLVLINTHNEAFDDGSQRKQQMAVLKDMMLAEYAKGNYVVVGGDWNQNPVGFSVARFSTADVRRTIEPPIEPDFFPEGWQWVFNPDIPTNRDVIGPYERGKTQTTIIDFFVVSPNVKVLAIKTDDIQFQWSDHQPITMVFKLNLPRSSSTIVTE